MDINQFENVLQYTFTIYIIYRDNDIKCEWNGELNELKYHYRNCELTKIKCEYCGESMMSKDLDKHYNNDCVSYPLECLLKCGKHIERHRMNYHLNNKCQNRLIKCPNNCDINNIKYKDMRQHINHECPLTQISCEFKKYGCNYKSKRIEMNNHLNDPKNINQHTLIGFKYILNKIKLINNQQKNLKNDIHNNAIQHALLSQKMNDIQDQISSSNINDISDDFPFQSDL